MTTVLWTFLWLILLVRPTLVFTQAIIKILPENTTVPREGDSVTLDCEISSIESPDDVRWSRRSSLQETGTVFVDENGLNPALVDNRFSISPFQASLYSHKLTIYPVRQSDQEYYQCHVLRGSDIIIQSVDVYLLVYRRHEFPVCTPDGPATVTIGSSLSCSSLSNTRTPLVSDIEIPTEANVGWITSPTNGEGSPGQELTRIVTNSEHGKTFQCFSIISGAVLDISPACKIGPLTVDSEYTQNPVQETTGAVNTTPDTPQNAGLSGADIAGIVIGVILLLIIIAVHTLCCRCNPKRWMYAKSYPFNVGSSFASTLERDNAILTQPDAKLRNAGPESDNLPFGVQASADDGIVDTRCWSDTEDDHLGHDHEPPATDCSPSNPKQPYKTTQVIDSKEPIEPKPPAIYAQVNQTSPVTGTKEPAKPNFPAVYAKVNETTPVTNSKEPTGLKSPGIYAQVNKPTPITDTSEPITHQPNPSVNSTEMDKNASQDDEELLKENGKDSSNLKNIKRFGQNRNGQVSRPAQQEPVLIYADLDLKEPVNDEVHPPSDDSQTVYAQIKY
ncbi:uncharacterized protein [Asterias amurensis]|uniref:uncharacterized protein n=1 Tax=Asterias amurensis TaxID=7602 RepID=UPI003AB4CDB9